MIMAVAEDWRAGIKAKLGPLLRNGAHIGMIYSRVTVKKPRLFGRCGV